MSRTFWSIPSGAITSTSSGGLVPLAGSASSTDSSSEGISSEASGASTGASSSPDFAISTASTSA